MALGLIGAKAWTATPAARRAYGFVWVTGAVLAADVMVIIGAAEGLFG